MRKKKPPEHENHERWLVSYADFITLLFAFFVVMFAVSQVDAQKMGRFVESVQVAFEYRGVFPQSTAHPIQGTDAGIGSGGKPVVVPPRVAVLAQNSKLSRRGADLKKAVEAMLDRSQLAGRVRVREDQRGVIVSLTEALFFPPGAASVRPESLETFREIAEVLRDSGVPVVVEGHTDSTPIHTPMFPSNWQLSTARATTILSYMVDELHFDPMRLSAAGYGQYRPVADNGTLAGRAQNRRVDLVVLTEGSDGIPPQ